MPSTRRFLHGLAAAMLALSLSGCGSFATSPAASPGAACAPGLSPFERDTLYFGRAIPTGGQVSEAEWLRFLDGTVTPAFPQGLTVIDAVGQWRGEAGAVVREPSKIVVLLHPRDDKADAAIAQVIAAYRQAFAQEAVLQERQAVCVRF
jgi:hypothetical protein